MTESSDSEFVCERCGADVNESGTFCPGCGALFQEHMVCVVHLSMPAAGVCVNCSKPFCKNCGGRVHKVFLCGQHASYEIYEMKILVPFAEVLESEKVLKELGLHSL